MCALDGCSRADYAISSRYHLKERGTNIGEGCTRYQSLVQRPVSYAASGYTTPPVSPHIQSSKQRQY